MAQTGRKIHLHEARRLAEKIVAELEPATERIAVAGSVRRGKAMVSDLEIVAVPKYASEGLFQDTRRNLLADKTTELMGQKRLRRLMGGSKYHKYHVGHAHAPVQLDLWMPATPDRWGVCLAIRTGPHEFSQRCVTPVSKDGNLLDYLRVADNRLWAWEYAVGEEPQPLNEIADLMRQEGKPVGPGGVVVDSEGLWRHVPTPEEADFFEHTTCGWIRPENRR